MARVGDNCTIPISEINKMTKELRDLKRTVGVMMSSARFAGESVMGMDALPTDAHPNSVCSMRLKHALRVRWLLKKEKSPKRRRPSAVTNGNQGDAA